MSWFHKPHMRQEYTLPDGTTRVLEIHGETKLNPQPQQPFMVNSDTNWFEPFEAVSAKITVHCPGLWSRVWRWLRGKG